MKSVFLFPRTRIGRRVPVAFALVVACLGSSVLLRAHSHSSMNPAPVKKISAPAIIPCDLETTRPNEAGEIPILEYHDIVPGSKASGYEYTAAEFRADMQRLYVDHFRPISLSDYVQGRISVPAGDTPFVLTFDDGLRGQFNMLPSGQIDPNCAVGILQAMNAAHPDWPLKATFFVLTNYDPRLPPPFYQPQFAEQKMRDLVQMGFEIGNHTVHHYRGMNSFPDSKAEAEFAGGAAGIDRYLPGYDVKMLALPYGVYPRNLSLVISGKSGNLKYHNICAMLAGANPAPSPLSARFRPYQLPRIIPGNERFALRYWLDYLQTHPQEKFISDGNPDIYTVPTSEAKGLDVARADKEGYQVRFYSLSRQQPHLANDPARLSVRSG